MRGWIFDVYPDYQKDHMVCWIKTEEGVEKLVDRRFFPTFYVYGSRKSLMSLADVVSVQKLRDVSFQRKKIKLGYDGKFEVLSITPHRYRDVKILAKMIDAQGGYRDFQLYNVDIRLAQRYLVEKGVFPMAYVDVGKEFILLDEQWAMEYPLPELRSVQIGVKVKSATQIKKFKDPIEAIKVGERVIKSDNERDVLRGLVEEIKHTDPDVVYTNDGDSFLFPYLYNRAEANGILDDIQLGREEQSSRPERAGRSFFRYGRVEYKPPFYTLRGRLHIDTSNSFLHMESGLKGLIELSRISCIPVQTLSKLSPGTAISAMQVNQALRERYVMIWKKNLPEDFKTAKELMVTDRGGFIYEPVVGIHDRVLELDFTSLYPSIMVRFNISPETVECPCCPDSRIRVPEIGYNICEKQVGLIAKVLKPVIQRRMVYKKKGKEGDTEYKERSDILKWLLVTSFGYTGYKNARYGRIECHESITAYGREIMLRSAEIAERHGYRVLHGIVDSLWLEGNGGHKALADHLKNDIGIPVEIEGVYKWIVFLPCKNIDVGAMNRYYGLFENGEMKIRGIETRRSDSPELVKKAQYEMLDILSKADDSYEFKRTIPEALGALKVWAERVMDGDVDIEDLIFTTRISKELEEYAHFGNQVAALTQLKKHKVAVHPGEIIRYLLVDSKSMKASKRLKIAELVEDGDEYDRKKYVEHLFKAGESLFQSFGYDLKRIEGEYGV
ncbi:MAG: DNA polymerase domain-containing protein [Thermoplasmata archaeon]